MSRANYNEDADELPKIASGRTTVPPNIFARDITKPTIEFKDPTEPGPSTAGPSGRNPPADEAEPMAIDFGTTSADEAEAMEVDEAPASPLGCPATLHPHPRGQGADPRHPCWHLRHHAAPRTLVGNAFRQGFYWPTAVADATDVVRTCEGRQFYARKTHLPAHAL